MTRMCHYVVLASCVGWLAGCSRATQNNMSHPSVDKLLATTDDFDLCDGVFCAIADVTGNQIDAVREPEPCRTVTLVWHSGGIIGNGGFQYLFESNFNGDPGYRKTADAYERIGAVKSYAAFQDALALFPGNSPPSDIDRRLKIYQSHPKEVRDKINGRFWADADEAKRLLAQFIRSRSSEFCEFLTAQP
jgi:hypothetical protein